MFIKDVMDMTIALEYNLKSLIKLAMFFVRLNVLKLRSHPGSNEAIMSI